MRLITFSKLAVWLQHLKSQNILFRIFRKCLGNVLESVGYKLDIVIRYHYNIAYRQRDQPIPASGKPSFFKRMTRRIWLELHLRFAF